MKSLSPKCKDIMEVPPRSAGNFRKIGIKRHRGGLGDVVMALAVAELYVKEKVPHLTDKNPKEGMSQGGRVTLGCPKELAALGENVPGVEVLPCRPTDNSIATPGAFDRITFGRLWDIADDKSCFLYEAALQPHVDRNRPEIWAQKLGLRGKPRPHLYLTAQEQAWGKQWVIDQGLRDRFLLGIVPKSASWGRDWQGWGKLLYLLKKRHPDIHPLIFTIGVQSWEEIELATIGHLIAGRPLREMLAVLAQCQLVVGVDTGPMHAAAALGRSTLWIFTHIGGSMRTRGYKKARVIQRTDLECCPCWYEARCHPPRYMLCKGIEVETVAKQILKYYWRWRLQTLCSLSVLKTALPLPNLSSAIGTMCPKTGPLNR